MGVIFFMSSSTGENSGGASERIIIYLISKYDKVVGSRSNIISYHNSKEFIDKANYIFRKTCHFGEYFVLSLLSFCFLVELKKYSILLCRTLSISFCFIYAMLDEYHQTFVRGRTGSITDVLFDTFGAIIGCIVISIVYYFAFI